MIILSRAIKTGLVVAYGIFYYSNTCAACKLDGPLAAPLVMSDFLRKPESILIDDASSNRGAQELSITISRIAATGPSSAVVQAIKFILPRATLPQKVAIGEGIYSAMTLCLRVDSATATRIERAVQLLADKDVSLAYARAASMSDPSGEKSHPEILTPFAATKPSPRGGQLIGEPTLTNPGSLKLADPFGSPDVWR